MVHLKGDIFRGSSDILFTMKLILGLIFLNYLCCSKLLLRLLFLLPLFSLLKISRFSWSSSQPCLHHSVSEDLGISQGLGAVLKIGVNVSGMESMTFALTTCFRDFCTAICLKISSLKTEDLHLVYPGELRAV